MQRFHRRSFGQCPRLKSELFAPYCSNMVSIFSLSLTKAFRACQSKSTSNFNLRNLRNYISSQLRGERYLVPVHAFRSTCVNNQVEKIVEAGRFEVCNHSQRLKPEPWLKISQVPQVQYLEKIVEVPEVRIQEADVKGKWMSRADSGLKPFP